MTSSSQFLTRRATLARAGVGGLAALAAPRRASAQTSPAYTITDLGTLGGSASWATAVSPIGHIVGFATTPDERRHAYLSML